MKRSPPDRRPRHADAVRPFRDLSIVGLARNSSPKSARPLRPRSIFSYVSFLFSAPLTLLDRPTPVPSRIAGEEKRSFVCTLPCIRSMWQAYLGENSKTPQPVVQGRRDRLTFSSPAP